MLAWNPVTGEFRSGQVDTAAGFEHWILKFDGVANNRDRERADPPGFGRIEYAYSRMARAAGVEMAPCRLHHEGGRSHFMTRRFDRDSEGRKLHMQSLGALRHSGFESDDLLRFATGSGLKRPAARRVVDELVAAVAEWPGFAADAGVPIEDIRRIARMHRLALGVGGRGEIGG